MDNFNVDGIECEVDETVGISHLQVYAEYEGHHMTKFYYKTMLEEDIRDDSAKWLRERIDTLTKTDLAKTQPHYQWSGDCK